MRKFVAMGAYVWLIVLMVGAKTTEAASPDDVYRAALLVGVIILNWSPTDT